MKPLERVDLGSVVEAATEADFQVQLEDVHGRVRQLLVRKRACADQVTKARQQLKQAEDAYLKVEKRLTAIREGKWEALGEEPKPGEPSSEPTA